MNRGTGGLTAGILLVVMSLCGGSMIQRSAVESFKQARGPDEAFETVNRLSPWAAVVNLAFYGGGVAIIVGIVILIIDGNRPAPEPPPRTVTQMAIDEENRRLREGLKRLLQDRDAGDHS